MVGHLAHVARQRGGARMHLCAKRHALVQLQDQRDLQRLLRGLGTQVVRVEARNRLQVSCDDGGHSAPGGCIASSTAGIVQDLAPVAVPLVRRR